MRGPTHTISIACPPSPEVLMRGVQKSSGHTARVQEPSRTMFDSVFVVVVPQRGASEPSGFRERLQAGGCSNAQIHWHNREQKKQSCSRYIPSRSPTKIPYQNLFQQISTRPMDVSCHRVIYGDSRHHLSSESPRIQRPLDMEVASAHGSGPSPVSFTRKKARDAHLSTHATGDGGVRPPPSHWIKGAVFAAVFERGVFSFTRPPRTQPGFPVIPPTQNERFLPWSMSAWFLLPNGPVCRKKKTWLGSFP
jgi:hypothetical protein